MKHYSYVVLFPPTWFLVCKRHKPGASGVNAQITLTDGHHLKPVYLGDKKSIGIVPSGYSLSWYTKKVVSLIPRTWYAYAWYQIDWRRMRRKRDSRKCLCWRTLVEWDQWLNCKNKWWGNPSLFVFPVLFFLSSVLPFSFLFPSFFISRPISFSSVLLFYPSSFLAFLSPPQIS